MFSLFSCIYCLWHPKCTVKTETRLKHERIGNNRTARHLHCLLLVEFPSGALSLSATGETIYIYLCFLPNRNRFVCSRTTNARRMNGAVEIAGHAHSIHINAGLLGKLLILDGPLEPIRRKKSQYGIPPERVHSSTNKHNIFGVIKKIIKSFNMLCRDNFFRWLYLTLDRTYLVWIINMIKWARGFSVYTPPRSCRQHPKAIQIMDTIRLVFTSGEESPTGALHQVASNVLLLCAYTIYI